MYKYIFYLYILQTRRTRKNDILIHTRIHCEMVSETFDGEVDLGIIGGTGLYHLSCLETIAVLPAMETPWGTTSSPITISKVVGHQGHLHVAFIARHGLNHQFPPTRVPFRANMAALKHIKCKAVLSFSAVGSCRNRSSQGILFCLSRLSIVPREFVNPRI